MSELNVKPVKEKEVLRIALDKEATKSYFLMVERLKAENTHIKVMPSQFVSFLVADFYKTYFDKDIGILVAEFFDSQNYYEASISQAKNNKDFASVMASMLENIQEIKRKSRRKTSRKNKKMSSNIPL